mmetsp:Transcript_36160/g.35759  ORF Transcript_36160/g.35759 Transcript_36160/m.35759 type:complete len:90 (+) Transcript_36160:3-272(+)
MDQSTTNLVQHTCSILALTNRCFNTCLMRGKVQKEVQLSNDKAKLLVQQSGLASMYPIDDEEEENMFSFFKKPKEVDESQLLIDDKDII